MANDAPRCETCYGSRWQFYTLDGKWFGLNRTAMQMESTLVLSVARALKVVRPCPACNPKGELFAPKDAPARGAASSREETPF